MKRLFATLTLMLATMLGLGVAGATAAPAPPPQQSQIPFGAYIEQVSTVGRAPNATFKQFIQLANRSPRMVPIGGFRVMANVGRHTFEVAQIPDATVLAPGQVYLLASARFTGPTPDQLFSTEQSIPNAVGLGLLNRRGEVLDTLATTSNTVFRSGAPAVPLTARDGASRLSLHRVAFTGSNRLDFRKAPATPGELPAASAVPAVPAAIAG